MNDESTPKPHQDASDEQHRDQATRSWPTELPSTKDPAVDRLLAAAQDLPGRSADEQAEFFERLHEELTAELDAAPGPTPRAAPASGTEQ